MRTLLFTLAALAGCAAPPISIDAPPRSPLAVSNPDWIEPVAPFRVIGPIHYVGSAELGIYLIATSRGLILLDGGLPDNAPMIAQSVATLGFDLRDVKILLNSHAHVDHSGGLAAIKAATGATLIASEGDRSALEGGFYLGSEDEHSLDAPPVKVDRVIQDGETVTLGDVTLTARITPGHTRGCTSWTMPAKEGSATYEVLFFCSASVAANRLVGPPQYEGIVEDYRRTFAQTAGWRPDILLANHAGMFGLEEKRKRLLAGDRLAFVDREAFPALRSQFEASFEHHLARQQAAQK
jgi:metallo-beta-lactamase class B